MGREGEGANALVEMEGEQESLVGRAGSALEVSEEEAKCEGCDSDRGREREM